MSEIASMHMGHGQYVDVVNRNADQWELKFRDGNTSFKLPPIEEVGADAIDVQGQIHPLKISSGEGPSSLLASGKVPDVYRMRVRVWHGNHFHTRETTLAGAANPQPQIGKNGGSVAKIDGNAAIEIKPKDATQWELTFLKNGAAITPPPATEVVVQAIGPKAEDYQIRNLTTEAKGSTLIASGKIGDATHARITVNEGEKEKICSVPVRPA